MRDVSYRKEFYEQSIVIHEKDVLRFIFSIVKNREDASDVGQITMMRAWEKLGALRNPEAAKAWLFQIAYREALLYIRKRGRESSWVCGADDYCGESGASLSGDDSVLDVLVKHFEEKTARQAFHQLSDEDQRLLYMRYVNCFSSKQISEITGINRGTVRSHLSRTIRRYREIYLRLEGNEG